MSKTKPDMTLVVKIGSAVLMRENSEKPAVDRGAFCRLVEALAKLIHRGFRVVIVTSGAVAVGRQKLGLTSRPAGIPRLQALAAVGQSRIMQLYEMEFEHHGLQVAQVLLTRDDFNERQRYVNARRTLEALHEFGALPIINENDSVGTEEIRFGDNDQLAAMVSAMISADELILLSDIDGLYTSNPRLDSTARRITKIRAADPSIDFMVSDTLDPARFGTGGMGSKIAAARMAARTGIPTTIAFGKAEGVLDRVLDVQVEEGTRLVPEDGLDRLAARKSWIGTGLVSKGRIWCDDGAVKAMKLKGTSLLPSGITGVEGDFDEGEAVELVTAGGEVFARGLVAYGSADIRKISGHQSKEIASILGYRVFDAVIHRDDMVLT